MQPQTASPRLFRVFLCHASEDKPVVEKLHRRLKKGNIDSWLDKEKIFGGQDWQYQIRRAVQDADIVLVCLSHISISKVGFVHKEVKLALEVADEQPEGGIFIIPLRLEACNVPDRLSHLHRLDLFDRGGFDRLMRTLELKRQSLNVAVAPINYRTPRNLTPIHSPTQPAFPVGPTTVTGTPTSQSMAPQRGISRRFVIGGLVVTALAVAITGGVALEEIFKRDSNTQINTPTSAYANQPRGTILNTYRGHIAGIRALAWSPNGQQIATAGDDHTAQVWDALTGKYSVVYQHADHVEGVAWSPDNTRIVTGCADGTAQIWNAKTGSHLYTYKGHTTPDIYQKHPWVNRVSWSPDSTRIASCDQTSDPQGVATVQIWDAITGKILITYRNHRDGVYAVAWSPEGKRIASAGYDGTLQIWDAMNGTNIVFYPSNAFLFGLSWSPDGTSVAVGSGNNTVLVVDSTSGNLLMTYQGHYNWVKDVSWTPDGRYIASGSQDGMIRLWDTTNGANIYTFNGHNRTIDAVGWSRDGKLIASGGNLVQVWKAL